MSDTLNIYGAPATDKIQISQGIRGRSVNEGMMMESITIDDWLEHIEKMV